MKSTVAMLTMLLTFSGYIEAARAQAKPNESAQIIEVKVTMQGFEPSSISVDASRPVTLKVTRETDATCATEIKVPKLHIKKDLPLKKPVMVALGKLNKGEIKFGCAMDMLGGVITAK